MRPTRSKQPVLRSVPLHEPLQLPDSSSAVEVIRHRPPGASVPKEISQGSSKRPRIDFDSGWGRNDGINEEGFVHDSFPFAPQTHDTPSDADEAIDFDGGTDPTIHHAAASLDGGGATLGEDDASIGIEDTEENEAPETVSTQLLESYLRYFYLHDAPHQDDPKCCSHSCASVIRQPSRRPEASVQGPDDESQQPPSPRPDGHYRCTDCFGNRMLCKLCIVRDHRILPFHRIEQWHPEEAYFGRTTLKQLGYCLYLGHNGDRCSRPSHSKNFVTVVHTNGHHDIDIAYCTCPSALMEPANPTEEPPPLPLHLQLLSHGIFPATDKIPRTGFTMQGLKRFHIANLESTMSLNEYHKLLVRLTNPVQPHLVRSTYKNFRLVVRQYRCLQLMKRVGRLHAQDLLDGELVILCPACPRPGFNLTEGWENDEYSKLLFTKFFSGDGNFHLPRLNNAAGESLQESMIGDAGFWVPQKKFEKYIQDTKSIPEPHSPGECNTQAGDPASSASSKKLAVTGVFGVSCRHVLLLPNGTTDLHKGERFRYVDVAIACIILAGLAEGLKSFCASYDIACKYSIHFQERVTTGDTPLITKEKWNLIKGLLWLIGKFHLGGHKAECSKKFSFNYTPGVGRMSGELVETVWAVLNYLKYQTQEMGPGPRKETISDHMNHWNWKKVTTISRQNLDSHRDSVLESQVAAGRLGAIEENIPTEQLGAMMKDFKSRGGEQFLPDPTRIAYPTRKAALKALQDQEALLLPDPTGAGASNSVPSEFINSALEIEILQIKFRRQLSDLRDSPTESHEKSAKASKVRLSKLLESHYHHLAALAPLHQASVSRSNCEPHEDPITLPSSFTKPQRDQLGLEALATVEVDLRLGHAHDALQRLRGALSVQSFLSRHSKGQHGYGAATRAQDSISRAHLTVLHWARVYRRSHKALLALDTPSERLTGLNELADSDLIMLSKWVEGEQYKTHGSLSKGPAVPLPWIWTLSPIVTSDTNLETDLRAADWNTEFVRLEWVHAKAAYARWHEDIILLKEEQRRIVVSFTRLSLSWSLRSAGRQDDLRGYPEAITRGWRGYCRKQAEVYARLARAALTNFDIMVKDKPELLQKLLFTVDQLVK